MAAFGPLEELKYRIVGALARPIVFGLCALADGELENREVAHRLHAEGRRIIYAFWHGRMLVPVWTHRNSSVGILVSGSRDGEYGARAAKALGFHVVRGSSTHNAEEGFRALLRALEEGYDVAVTPDGPTGPKYEVKKGIIYLARAAGAAILPVGIAIDKYRQLGSWDEFRIFLPGSYILGRYGEPLMVPEHSSKLEMEAMRRRLEDELDALTRDVEARVAEAARTRHTRPRRQGE